MNQDVVTFKSSYSNHHDAGLDILRTALEESVNQAAYQLQQNLGGGVETRPPRGRILTRGRGRQGEVGGSTPPTPPAIRTLGIHVLSCLSLSEVTSSGLRWNINLHAVCHLEILR